MNKVKKKKHFILLLKISFPVYTKKTLWKKVKPKNNKKMCLSIWILQGSAVMEMQMENSCFHLCFISYFTSWLSQYIIKNLKQYAFIWIAKGNSNLIKAVSIIIIIRQETLNESKFLIWKIFSLYKKWSNNETSSVFLAFF